MAPHSSEARSPAQAPPADPTATKRSPETTGSDEDQRSEDELVVLLLVHASGESRSVGVPIRATAECPNGTQGARLSHRGSLLVFAHGGRATALADYAE
jgi:hypothetical protein